VKQKAPKPVKAVKTVKKKAPARKPAAKATSKPTAKAASKPTASAKVYQVIGDAANGANMALLKEKTGFNDKMIANILYKLKKQNKIKSPKRGLYVKV
jgi:hypothetical protein